MFQRRLRSTLHNAVYARYVGSKAGSFAKPLVNHPEIATFQLKDAWANSKKNGASPPPVTGIGAFKHSFMKLREI